MMKDAAMKTSRSDSEIFDVSSPVREDRERELGKWTKEQAIRTAEKDGIALTDEHWCVIDCLRDYYLEKGLSQSARELSDMLEAEFTGKGGLKYLYRLFPKGPVSQGMRIAGLPLPAYTKDTGFGSSI